MFGSRLLMLEHVGRRTCARRYVVLEVVEHLACASLRVAIEAAVGCPVDRLPMGRLDLHPPAGG